MKNRHANYAFGWSARIITILYALFLAIYAADVFEERAGFWETTLAMIIHLLPCILILLILWFAWKNEWVGGIFYLILGGAYITAYWGRFSFQIFLVIAGPLILIGILFWITWFTQKRITAGGKPS